MEAFVLKKAFGKIHFHFGPMKGEKGLWNVRECMRAQYAHEPPWEAKFFKSARETGADRIESRLGLSVPAEVLPVDPRATCFRLLEVFAEPCIVGIDEAQFLYVPEEGEPVDADLVALVHGTLIQGMKAGCEIHLSGLDADFRGEPFPVSQALLCDPRVHKRQLKAICAVCRSDTAIMTQRLYKGKPAPRSMPTVVPKGEDPEEKLVRYEPRCPACHEIPD